jgi:hypothetical protein
MQGDDAMVAKDTIEVYDPYLSLHNSLDLSSLLFLSREDRSGVPRLVADTMFTDEVAEIWHMQTAGLCRHDEVQRYTKANRG